MDILLIEDNLDHASLVRAALSAQQVTHAASLGEARRTPRLAEFDVLLTDLSLPDASGLETVAQLRREAPEAPLIVLSCLADDKVALKALECGAQDYLVKEEIFGGAVEAASMLERAIRYAVRRHEVNAENQRLVRELQESKVLLEQKNQRLGALYETANKFVENVSHDFRTPLTVIKEYSSLIRDGVVGEVSDEQQRMLHVVEDRADDLNTMVDDLLDVSRCEAGLLNVWRRNANLSDVVEHVVRGLERKALVRSVRFEATVPDDLPPVYCDEEKVGRIITNLVVNAIKFCREAGLVKLWVRPDDDRQEVVVGVTDNGPGIPPEKVEQIFERFTQLSSSVRQSAKGFGLGLSIAKELVDLNLGRMDVSSVVGEGSTFTFTLPYAELDAIYSRYAARMKSLHGELARSCAIAVSADPQSSERDLHDLDIFLSQNLRREDLLLHASEGRWIMLLSAPPTELGDFLRRSQEALADLNRNRPFGRLPAVDFSFQTVWRLSSPLADLLDQLSPASLAAEACCG